MAIWQFECSLIPRTPLISRPGGLLGRLPAQDAADAWLAGPQPPEGYQAVIDSFAPRYESWSDSILMWGREDGDRAHVGLEAGRVEWITCRLDLRRFSPKFARGVLRLAAFCNSVLMEDSGRLLEPEWGVLVGEIRGSDAMRFVVDPHGFLEGLANCEMGD